MDFSHSPYYLEGIPMDEDYAPCVDKREDPTPKPSMSNSQEKTESYEGAISGLSVEITNMVCNFQLPMHIDLRRVANSWDNVIMTQRALLEKKVRNPACMVQVRNTGKISILGCTTEEDCKRVARGIGRSIQRICDRLGEPMRIRDYRISNIIANTKVPFNVNLPKLASQHKGKECIYEPEISTTVDYKYRDIIVTARVFHTGSIVLLGATSKEAIVTALKRIFPYLLAARSANTTQPARRYASSTRTIHKRTHMAVTRSQVVTNHCNGTFPDEEDLYAEEHRIITVD